MLRVSKTNVKKRYWVCHLDRLMAKHNLTQTDLKEQTGISTSTISKIQNHYSTRIDLNTLNTLASYFEIESENELLECIIEED